MRAILRSLLDISSGLFQFSLSLFAILTLERRQERLKGTLSGDKNEILFSEFGINYNNEPEQFKKGTTVVRTKVELPAEGGGTKVRGRQAQLYCDIIGQEFWTQHPDILGPFEQS